MGLTKSEGLSNTLFCTGQSFYKVKTNISSKYYFQRKWGNSTQFIILFINKKCKELEMRTASSEQCTDASSV